MRYHVEVDGAGDGLLRDVADVQLELALEDAFAEFVRQVGAVFHFGLIIDRGQNFEPIPFEIGQGGAQ